MRPGFQESMGQSTMRIFLVERVVHVHPWPDETVEKKVYHMLAKNGQAASMLADEAKFNHEKEMRWIFPKK